MSLLLHAAALLLLIHHGKQGAPKQNQTQSITVALLGAAPASPTKTRQLPALTPPAKIAPEPRPVVPETTAIAPPTVSAAPAAAAPSAVASANISASDGPAYTVQALNKLTRPPAFLHRIEPVYPGSEQRAGSQANVLAEVTIDPLGNVVAVRIVKSAGNSFDDAVIEALKKSAFVPGYINTEAVAVRVLVPFRFTLK